MVSNLTDDVLENIENFKNQQIIIYISTSNKKYYLRIYPQKSTSSDKNVKCRMKSNWFKFNWKKLRHKRTKGNRKMVGNLLLSIFLPFCWLHLIWLKDVFLCKLWLNICESLTMNFTILGNWLWRKLFMLNLVGLLYRWLVVSVCSCKCFLLNNIRKEQYWMNS